MSQLSLFDDDAATPPRAARLAPKLRALAERGIYFGTSSWKYEGWLGQIYAPENYAVHGKFSQTKFEKECLREYAKTFPVVGGDFSFYQFPSPPYWKNLFEAAPGLKFALKVPEEVTVAKWPKHARYGKRAGLDNESFLNANVFEKLFANPLRFYVSQVAALIFEFGTFSKSVFADHRAFVDRIDSFLTALPKGFRYALEIRNPEYLTEQYFETLARHGVAHAFNAWTRMPELDEQMAKPGAFTTDITVVRALLKRGCNYEKAVEMYSPYERVQEPNTRVRDALVALSNRSLASKTSAFILVNNRLEGCAPETIEETVSRIEA
jgi:uncharacterized protein YecE (DUF72 family)